MAELTDRVALVTGGATGIGRAIATIFAREGAKVTIADINAAGGEATAKALGADFQHMDVSQEGDWIAAIEAIKGRHGRLDILVNNAAIFRHNIPFLEMPIETWREQMTINADSVFLGCKHGIPAMAAGGRGAIINMSSLGALMAIPTSAAYCASKAAVLMTTRVAARVGGPLKVRVNAILPGLVLTDMSRAALEPGQSEEDYVAMALPMYPVGRVGVPEDMAEAALFLASDRSSFVSGHLMRVDGAQDP